jgi:ABC-type phosphate transport system substrate-binding protein
LTLDIWAKIYLNQITTWNDPSIVAINPSFASILPNRTITVVLGTDASPLTRIVTTSLSAANADFNATVGVVDNPSTYPVLGQPNRTDSVVGAESALASRMNGKANTFSALSSGQLATAKSVRMAALYNPSNGRYIVPSPASIQAAMEANANATLIHLFLGARNCTANLNPLFSTSLCVFVLWSAHIRFSPAAPGENSYPLVVYDTFLISKNSTDCTKAAALSDWMYWTQSSTTALKVADRNGVVLTSEIPVWKKMMLKAVTGMTCNGAKVSSIAGCVTDGVLCSDRGQCIYNSCECSSGYEGTHCEIDVSTSSSDSTVLAATLGAIIPAIVLVVLLLIVLMIVLVVLARRKRSKDAWEIDTDELEIAETLGTGGYGEVFRAKWRGTEVAVKMMAARDNLLTKDMQRNFAEEVRVMTALRHPNVVLFMAACTKPPNMCIVMEFMGLGSLYEVTNFHHQHLRNCNRSLTCSLCVVARSCSTMSSSPSCPSRSRSRWRTRRPRACTSCIRQASCIAISSRSTCCSTTSGMSRSRTLASPSSRRSPSPPARAKRPPYRARSTGLLPRCSTRTRTWT